ncbi:hypothetical protein Btru_073745 [Bulinus truncatus]|nr:hypothetical protein Btru_073745 [Bulinus truncatus]
MATELCLNFYIVLRSKVNKFTYTTCTCPGSSGAIVHFVGYKDCVGGKWLYHHVHSGSLNSKLNCSGAGYVLF